ncbi:MAG TPA: hypothetical protein VFH12_08915 [Pseudoxanthomonas sp.]|nr:hypothetical protein [Pseudoxanthomonas sp.]
MAITFSVSCRRCRQQPAQYLPTDLTPRRTCSLLGHDFHHASAAFGAEGGILDRLLEAAGFRIVFFGGGIGGLGRGFAALANAFAADSRLTGLSYFIPTGTPGRKIALGGAIRVHGCAFIPRHRYQRSRWYLHGP